MCYSEEYIALAILRLVEVEKSVVEGAGAAGLAAVLSGQLPELKGKKLVTWYTVCRLASDVIGHACADSYVVLCTRQ